MKKILLIFALYMIFLPLSGCGGKEDGKTEIVIWEQKDPEEQVLLDRHIARFMQKHPDIIISTVHFETDQLHSQFQTASLAGGGPDLVYGPSDKVGPYSVMQLIQPLEDIFEKAFFDSYEKQSVPSLEGHIYAVPDQIGNHLMLIYNKALVDRLPADTDEWISMMREIAVDRDGDGFPEVYGVVFNSVEPFWLIPFLGGYGGWVFDKDNNPTLATAEMAAALQFLADLRNRYGVLPRECNYELSDTMFKKGQAAFLINGPWSLKGYLGAGLDIGVMPIPMITGTGKYPEPMVSSKGYSINVNVSPRKMPQVKQLLVFLTSEQVQKEIVEELLILPSISSLYNDPALSANELVRGSMEQARLGRAMPAIPEMRAVWDAIRPFYQSVLSGNLEPEKAAARMQATAVKKIAEMKK